MAQQIIPTRICIKEGMRVVLKKNIKDEGEIVLYN
jgi:hypothetical protein